MWTHKCIQDSTLHTWEKGLIIFFELASEGYNVLCCNFILEFIIPLQWCDDGDDAGDDDTDDHKTDDRGMNTDKNNRKPD